MPQGRAPLPCRSPVAPAPAIPPPSLGGASPPGCRVPSSSFWPPPCRPRLPRRVHGSPLGLPLCGEESPPPAGPSQADRPPTRRRFAATVGRLEPSHFSPTQLLSPFGGGILRPTTRLPSRPSLFGYHFAAHDLAGWGRPRPAIPQARSGSRRRPRRSSPMPRVRALRLAGRGEVCDRNGRFYFQDRCQARRDLREWPLPSTLRHLPSPSRRLRSLAYPTLPTSAEGRQRPCAVPGAPLTPRSRPVTWPTATPDRGPRLGPPSAADLARSSRGLPPASTAPAPDPRAPQAVKESRTDGRPAASLGEEEKEDRKAVKPLASG